MAERWFWQPSRSGSWLRSTARQLFMINLAFLFFYLFNLNQNYNTNCKYDFFIVTAVMVGLTDYLGFVNDHCFLLENKDTYTHNKHFCPRFTLMTRWPTAIIWCAYQITCTNFVVIFRLLAKLWRVVLSNGYHDVTAGGREFQLWDKLAGTVSQRHLPDSKRQPEDRGDTYWVAQDNPLPADTHTQPHNFHSVLLDTQFPSHIWGSAVDSTPATGPGFDCRHSCVEPA